MNNCISKCIDLERLESIPELAGRLHRRVMPPGSTVFREGEGEKVIVLVHRGFLKVIRSSGTGRDLITELLFPGDICGTLCAMDAAPYPVTATCITECELTLVPADLFMGAVQGYPDIFSQAIQVCRGKMRFQREMMVGMAVESADQRAARVLLLLACRLGRRVKGSVHIPALLNRQELSELMGTTVETAIRVFSRFRRKGWIEETRNEIIILDEEALHELVPFSELST